MVKKIAKTMNNDVQIGIDSLDLSSQNTQSLPGYNLPESNALELNRQTEVDKFDGATEGNQNNEAHNGSIEESVLSHLLFHKSIISDRDTGERLNEYLNMVRSLQAGSHISIKDPFDKSIALMFELIINNRINPWDVDLVKFSNLYVDRVRKETDIDFVTAGKIIFMAWSILKLQSDELLAQTETIEEQEEYEPPPAWAENITDVDQAFTERVLNSASAPITEMVRRKGNRPVTLIELVSAFEEARKEAAIQEIISEQRRLAREKQAVENMAKVKGMMHKESLQEDLTMTFAKISQYENEVPISKLHNGSKEELMTVLISILFLAFNRKIKVWQKDFPKGEIFVRKIDENELN
jgi:segregation and condensation protein A